MKPTRCGSCGKKDLKRQLVDGPFAWKDFPRFNTIQPIELLKCSSCGEFAYLPNDTEVIDRAVEASVRAIAAKLVQQILKREDCSQIILAQRIGVTPEYLSGIKNSSRTIGFQTFNLLKIFAEDPNAFKVSDPFFELKEILESPPIAEYNAALKKLA